MLEIRNLSFSYGRLRVFDNFNFCVPEGQVCLITGINGVGKSTLLRLIAGALCPAEGTINFNNKVGIDLKRKIGFISDTLSLYENQTVAEAIDFHKSVYNISKFDDSLLRHTKLNYVHKIKELSTGQRTIFHLSLILSIEPDILLIDEIIHSIDAYLRKVFLEQLSQLLSQRRIIVIMVNLNYHDIEPIVERVILLKAGEIAVDEKIESLKAKVKKIVSTTRPQYLNILSQINYPDHFEFFVYPFKDEYEGMIDGKVVDLDLTEIISAFIGGEYA